MIYSITENFVTLQTTNEFGYF